MRATFEQSSSSSLSERNNCVTCLKSSPWVCAILEQNRPLTACGGCAAVLPPGQALLLRAAARLELPPFVRKRQSAAARARWVGLSPVTAEHMLVLCAAVSIHPKGLASEALAVSCRRIWSKRTLKKKRCFTAAVSAFGVTDLRNSGGFFSHHVT